MIPLEMFELVAKELEAGAPPPRTRRMVTLRIQDEGVTGLWSEVMTFALDSEDINQIREALK